mmetsp:Transcript_100144/g.188656  ORF Transcript_100144/g.188656 Transcript_100144/m.188656 type:complete len:178 (-) Transcript_100144:9-542(-)
MGQHLTGLGAPESEAVELRSPEEVGGRQRFSEVFPWTDLVSRAADSWKFKAAGNRDGSWSDPGSDELLFVLEKAEPRIRELTASTDKFLETCHCDDAAGAAMVLPTWAAALLEQIPELSETRYRLVPRRLSEEVFWSRYFTAVFSIIIEELEASMPCCGRESESAAAGCADNDAHVG